MRGEGGRKVRGLVVACAAIVAVSCAPERTDPSARAPSAASSSVRPPPLITNRAPIVDWPPIVMRCLQLGDTCGGSAATCRGLATLSEDARADAMRCFTSTTTCDAYAECLRAFLASTLVPDVPARGPNDEK